MAMAKVRIQEVRKLLLPTDTVVDAILELDRSHGGALAKAELLEVRIESGGDPGLSLVLMQGSGKAAVTVEKHFTLPAIAAAAIHYCFRARIPLPRQGTKSIEVMPDGYQLTISTVSEVLRLHDEIPKISHVERAAPAASAAPAHEVTGDAALDSEAAAASDESAAVAAPTTDAQETASDAQQTAAA